MAALLFTGAAIQPQSGAGPNWIVDALQRNVDTHPHWPVYRFLDHNGNVADFMTCYGANHAARSVADFLLRPKKKRGLGLKRGDRVALVYPPGTPSTHLSGIASFSLQAVYMSGGTKPGAAHIGLCKSDVQCLSA